MREKITCKINDYDANCAITTEKKTFAVESCFDFGSPFSHVYFIFAACFDDDEWLMTNSYSRVVC